MSGVEGKAMAVVMIHVKACITLLEERGLIKIEI